MKIWKMKIYNQKRWKWTIMNSIMGIWVWFFSVSMFLCFVEDPKTSKNFELTLNIQFNLSFEFLCYFEFIDDKWNNIWYVL